MAGKKNQQDPTVSSPEPGARYPEGTQPAVPVEKADDAAVNKQYRDNPDKPDPSTVAQVEEVKPA